LACARRNLIIAYTSDGFFFCGELLERADVKACGEPFSFRFTTSFPNATLPEGMKTCAVDFLAEIPWVFPEAPE
jgi:hypothetical protein